MESMESMVDEVEWYSYHKEWKEGFIDIHVHYGGYFKTINNPPTLVYTSKKVKVCEDCDISNLTMDSLFSLYLTVEKATNAKFFYQCPCSVLDIGVLPIEDDTEIACMLTYHSKMPQMHLYSEKGEMPLQVVSPDVEGSKKMGDKDQYISAWEEVGLEQGEGFIGRVANGGQSSKLKKLQVKRAISNERKKNRPDIFEDTDCLQEGLERSEEDDIFKDSGNSSTENTKARHNDDGGLDKRDRGIDSTNDGTNFYVDLPLKHENTREEVCKEDYWNEKVDVEENLLDTRFCDDEDATFDDQHPEFNSNVEFAKPEFILEVGQKFQNVYAFRKALVEWHVREGFEMWYVNNEKCRVVARCKRGCNWKIRATPIQGSTTFQIKSLDGKHVCGRAYKNIHATSTFLSKKMQHHVMDDPNINIEALSNKIRRECMLDVSKNKAYRTKNKAIDILHGVDMEQYNKVREYANVLLQFNPGSRITVHVLKETDDSTVGVFQRMFYCLGAMRDGFLAGCRPIIGLDGCFLKSPFGGQLLTAMGRDGNDNMFPIAMAVVEVERFDSWCWFLEELKYQIGEKNNYGVPWTFISDRQKGLVHAIEQLYPSSENRYCLRHMYQNFKQKFKGQDLKGLFWAAACVGNIADFGRAMVALENADPKKGDQLTAVEWLRKIPPNLWSRAHFSDRCKSDILVNNLNESFNSYILKARDKPIISMFEWIRRRLMQRLTVKRNGMENYDGNFCPNIHERLETNKRQSRLAVAIYSSPGEYEVDYCGVTYVVKLEHKTCTCGYFQLTGVPCLHAIAAIDKDKRSVDPFVDKSYSKEAYLRTYGYTIKAIPSMHYWEDVHAEPIHPPTIRRQLGRPKKMRRREADESKPTSTSTRKGLTVHCKRCFKPGHNSRTCKNEIHPKSKFYKSPATEGVSQASSSSHKMSNGAKEATNKKKEVIHDGVSTKTIKQPRGTRIVDGRFVGFGKKRKNQTSAAVHPAKRMNQSECNSSMPLKRSNL